MADKIIVEIYKTKITDELTKLIADPDSRLETGSGAAIAASIAAALLCRVSAAAIAAGALSERTEYIARNAEIVRNYMVHLIDEDVKCRGPLRRALKEGKQQEIEAAMRPAVSICEEIINMMMKCLDMLLEIMEVCPAGCRHYAVSGADMAMGAVKAAMRYVLHMSEKSSEETYRFVTRRENELTLAQCEAVYGQILSKS